MLFVLRAAIGVHLYTSIKMVSYLVLEPAWNESFSSSRGIILAVCCLLIWYNEYEVFL